MQLKRELRANKSKEIQGKSLAFPCILLAEMGLFNALRRIQIKKSLRSQLAFRVVSPEALKRDPLHSPCRRTCQRRGQVLEMGSDITRISVLEKLLQGSYSVSCWQRKFRMLWRRETGPEASWRACPGYPRVSAQRATARGGEVKKALFLRPSRPPAALPGLVSEAARRGWPGQARPGRERLRDESEAARQQLTL
jgi:hypothetical protein